MSQPLLEELLKKANAALAAKTAAEEDEDSDSKRDSKADSKKDVDPEKKHRAAAKARADHLLNMKSTKGMLADYITPGTFGQGRAGRATQIAQALGIEPGLTTKYPVTTAALPVMMGAGIGSAMGSVGGPLGLVAGGNLGALGASSIMGAIRRSNMNRIRNALERDLVQTGGANIEPKRPEFGVASSLLLPGAGNHRAGQADAYNALMTGKKYPSMLGRNTVNTLNSIPYVNLLSGPVSGVVQNFNARARTRDPEADSYGNLDDYEFQPRKAASALEFGVALASEKAAAPQDPSFLQSYGNVLNRWYNPWTTQQVTERGEQELMRGGQAAMGVAGLAGAGALAPFAGMSGGAATLGNTAAYGGLVGSGMFGQANLMRAAQPQIFQPRAQREMQPTPPATPQLPQPAKPQLPQPVQAPGLKRASALKFGVKLANIDPKLLGGLGGAAALGLGGAALGAMNPGEEETVDDNGRVVKRQKSRLGGALTGLAGGAAVGGLGGAAAGHFFGPQVQEYGNKLRSMLGGGAEPNPNDPLTVMDEMDATDPYGFGAAMARGRANTYARRDAWSAQSPVMGADMGVNAGLPQNSTLPADFNASRMQLPGSATRG